MEDYEDYIVAWYSDGNGNFQEILINEETAMSTTHPIFIIDNAESFTETNKYSSNLKGQASTTGTIRQVIDQYKINYRYDKSRRSEYSYEIVYRYNGGGYSYGGYRTEIREIHKRDIGKMFYNDFDIWQIQHIENLSGINLVTFEYDWWASKKSVYSPGSIIVQCRMKYNNEYYQSFHIPINQSITTSSSKGYIKVKKQ